LILSEKNSGGEPSAFTKAESSIRPELRRASVFAGPNLNSDIAFTENPISFGIDPLKIEVSTSPKLALL
jgi:hypothetical protein